MKLGVRMGKDYALPADRVCLAGQECTGQNGGETFEKLHKYHVSMLIFVFVLMVIESELHISCHKFKIEIFLFMYAMQTCLLLRMGMSAPVRRNATRRTVSRAVQQPSGRPWRR